MKKNTKICYVQNWLNFIKILDNGIVLLKNKKYIKIIKVLPINFFMKTDFEQESILEAYKTFLKTCNFDIQILIQSKKENISSIVNLVKEQIEKDDNEKINELRRKYINYIEDSNIKSKSSSKNFYIVIKKENNDFKDEEIIKEELKDKYLKIKNCLIRCGNEVEEISKEEIKEVIYSFFNTRKYLNVNKEII